MMRRAMVAALAGVVVGLVVPAVASHITEPTHAITGYELKLEDYAGTYVLACDGTDVITFHKVRISPLAESASAWTGPNGAGVPGHHDPSEHFSTGWQIDERYVPNPAKPNVFGWRMEERTVWAHSNIPGDTQSSKFNVAYATITPGQPNGGSSTVLDPGTYRITAELLGDVSGVHLTQDCQFTVT